MRFRYLLAGLLLVSAFASMIALASTFTTFDVPGATSSQATGINARGQIVGIYVANGETHGFLLDRQTFTTIDVPGGTDTEAYGINNTGEIVGLYRRMSSTHGLSSTEADSRQ